MSRVGFFRTSRSRSYRRVVWTFLWRRCLWTWWRGTPAWSATVVQVWRLCSVRTGSISAGTAQSASTYVQLHCPDPLLRIRGPQICSRLHNVTLGRLRIEAADQSDSSHWSVDSSIVSFTSLSSAV
jgi:hypothetical protein